MSITRVGLCHFGLPTKGALVFCTHGICRTICGGGQFDQFAERRTAPPDRGADCVGASRQPWRRPGRVTVTREVQRRHGEQTVRGQSCESCPAPAHLAPGRHQKGTERRWIKSNTAWDQQAAHALYERVAYASLAHWLDGKCKPCGGTGQQARRLCTCCNGTGTGHAALKGGSFERERALDTISELEGLMQSHDQRATRRLATRGK